MGCFASKKPPPVQKEQEEQKESQEDDEETKELIQQILQRIEGIRTKAEDYNSNLQLQVADIENSKIGLLEEQPVRVNGIVTVGYEPESTSEDVPLFNATEGQEIEILIREMGGWSYCRRIGDKTPGWLPADRIAELAQLIADHEVGDSEGLLNLRSGDVVEVISRHYSGWAQCRLWAGPQLPGAVERQIGWVTDAYLQDNRSEAMLASKWHRLVLQALDEVVAYAVQLETYLKQAKPEDRSADPEWVEKCTQFCLYLGTELQQITEALSQHGLSQNATGKYATTVVEVVGNSEYELSASVGARVFIVDAENADWAWCRLEDGSSEGWLPRNVLIVEPGDAPDKDLPDWIKVGEKARWWSNSQKQFCDVNISVVDETARQVTVTFVQDTSCWKMVPFEHFKQNEDAWLLHPFQPKAKELYLQLPEWVRPGSVAYWWSTSQHRVLPVQIRDVCSRTRQVKIAFVCNKTVKKLLQFHELIASPKECLLQKDRAGHAWRKPRRKSRDRGGSKEAAIEAGSQTEASEPDTGAKALGDIMAEMTQDIGDMMGGENDDSEDGLRKALTFMGTAEFLQTDLENVEESMITPAGPADSKVLGASGDFEASLRKDKVVEGSALADAITSSDLVQAEEQVESGEGKKSKVLMGLSKSEENIMEALEAIADDKGPTASTTASEGLFNTFEKELLNELAPPSPTPVDTEETGVLNAEAMIRSTAQAGPSDSPASPKDKDTVPAEGTDVTPHDAEQSKEHEPTSPTEAQVDTRTPSPEQTGEASTEQGGTPALAVAAAESHEEGVPVAETSPQGAAVTTPATPVAETSPEGAPVTPAVETSTEGAPITTPAVETSTEGPKVTVPAVETSKPSEGVSVTSGKPKPEGPSTPPADRKPSKGFFPDTGTETGQSGDVPAPATTASKSEGALAPETPKVNSSPGDTTHPAAEGKVKESVPAVAADPVVPASADRDAAAAEDPGNLLAELMIDEEMKQMTEAKEKQETEQAEEEGPMEDMRSPEEIREQYLEDLACEQAEAEARQAAKAEAKPSPAKVEEQEAIKDLTTSVTLRRDLARTTPLFREALRLVVPDSWDSEEEEKTGRKRPDVYKLASCWEILEKDFEMILEGEFARIDEEFGLYLGADLNKIQAQEKDLKERIEVRAKEAEGKLDPGKAQELRSMAQSVANNAETAKEQREAAKAARVDLARRKVRARKEALRKSLGDEPTDSIGKELLKEQLPTPEVIKQLSAYEALAEVSATAASCFRALQVVALRPPEEGRTAGDGPDAAWVGEEQKKKDLVHATAEALPELHACLEALRKRLMAEKNAAPEVDPKLRTIATDEDKMTKDDKREFIMFEGQQEYDWERQITLKMKEQMRRRDVHTQECLRRVTRALTRRWRRDRDRDKARSLERIDALLKSMDAAEAELDRIRKEHLQIAQEQAEELEGERRRLQEQTRVLMGAALVVRQEKARMNKAWYAEPREKRALLFQSLKIIRRLHTDMINFPVTAEFKQKHSVLLYSLRMLEGRLRKDCPSAKETDIQEGPLEETPELKAQLEEVDADFEAQLAADLDELRALSRAKGQRAMAKEAAQRRRVAEEYLAPALKEAQDLVLRSERAARRTEIAEDLLRPVAMLSSQLGAEAFRHEQLQKGNCEPASFGPKRKRQEASLGKTLEVLETLLTHLDAEEVKKVAAAPSKLGKEAEWEEAVEKASRRWKLFCAEHPATVPEEQETPRGDKTFSAQTSIASTLALDSLDGMEDEVDEAPKKLPPPPPAKKQVPNRPPSAGSNRPPAPSKPPAPGAKAVAQPLGASGQSTKKGAALLEKLDELSATMDRTLGKNSALKSTTTSGGRSLKPPGIGKGKR